MNNTQQNLLRAFAGESMARNKYTQFAKMARKENLEWIARVFEETAENERVHAEEEWELITETVKTTGNLEISPYKKTSDNLKMAAEGEKYEWTTMYPDFEKIAIQEKEEKAAKLFGAVKLVEEKHEERYMKLVEMLENNTLFSSEKDVEWKCLNCGYIHKGKSAPDCCPSCKKPQSWYMQLNVIR